VTSTPAFAGAGLYLEGRRCPPARFGYSRDGKRHKLQIVFGVLCRPRPIAVEVFPTGQARGLKAHGKRRSTRLLHGCPLAEGHARSMRLGRGAR
jgi:hypothetical protein